jgi:hypothetical protein
VSGMAGASKRPDRGNRLAIPPISGIVLLVLVIIVIVIMVTLVATIIVIDIVFVFV